MAVFKVILILREGNPPYPTHQRVVYREFPGTDIDLVWHKLQLKSEQKWGRDLKSFDCVMISRRSPDYQAFLAAQAKDRPKPDMKIVPGPPRGSGHRHPFVEQQMKKPR